MVKKNMIILLAILLLGISIGYVWAAIKAEPPETALVAYNPVYKKEGGACIPYTWGTLKGVTSGDRPDNQLLFFEANDGTIHIAMGFINRNGTYTLSTVGNKLVRGK